MKSKHLLLTLLLAILAPWAAQAQETLTVYDETTGTLTSNSYVPMYGNYFDAYTKSEFVIPADQLSDMDGGTITSLKFYIQSVGTYGSGWSSNQQVFLKEVSSTSLSAFSGTDDATIVWEGSFTVPSSSDTEFEITFTTPYEYQGGNLLVGIYNITKGGYRDVAWYGRPVTGASGSGNNSSSLSGITFSQKNFIPKTTFTYEAAASDCPKPNNFVASNVTAHTADLSWESDGFEFVLQYKKASDSNWTQKWPDANSYTLTGLAAETEYQARVAAFHETCPTDPETGDHVHSDWRETSFTTGIACFAPTNLAVTDGSITAREATVTWEGTSDSYVVMIGEENLAVSADFEDQTIPAAFTNTGARPWTVTAGGANGSGYCAIPGNKGANSSQSDLTLEVTLDNPATVSFNAKVSSENNYDWGRFFIDGTQMMQISGSQDWTAYSYELAAGTHTLIWRYYKDNTSASGNDLFYVDDIIVSTGVDSWTEYDTNALTYTFENLTPETPYQVKVKGNCGDEGFSAEAGLTFTTTATCPMPENLQVTTDGATAVATWTGTATDYDIDINGTVYNNVTSPYEFNVELSSTYAVMVQANCNDETSGWTEAYSFTTPPCVGGHIIEYTLNDTYGDGWTGTTISAIIINDACGVYETLTLPNGSYNSGTFSLCGDFYQFVWQQGQYDYETSFTLTVDGTPIYINQSGSSLTAGQVLLTIGTAPDMLPKPTALSAGTPEKREVELSWTENGTATAWEICVNGDETNLVAANSNPFTLTGLTPETDYAVKVRSTDGTDVSCWTDEITFTTDIACSAPTNLTATNIALTTATLSWEGDAESYNVRYKKANLFEDDFEHGLDQWTVIRNNEGINNTDWSLFDGNFTQDPIPPHSGSYMVMSRSWSNDNAYDVDNWLITPQVTLDGELHFWVRDDGTYHEHYEVYVSTTGNTIADFGSTPFYEPGDATNSWTEIVVDLSSFARAQGYIALRHTDNDQDYILIDDFGIHVLDEWTEVTSATNTLDITGLTAETQYVFQVQANCGTENGLSSWSAATSFTTLTPVTFTKRIIARIGDETPDDPSDDGGWNLIASPVGQINPTNVGSMCDNDYDLYHFNQSAENEWENYKVHGFDLELGKGYLYSNHETVELVFAGLPLTVTEKTIDLVYDGDAEFDGWNLVGNPFAETAYVDRSYYTLNDAGSEVWSVECSGSVEAMEGIFVVAGEDGETVTFTTTDPGKSANLALNVSKGRSVIDRAIVSFKEGSALPKFQLNPNHTKVYIPQNGKDYAVVYSEGQGEMPVNFKAEKDGTYTMSFNAEEVTFNYLHLIDNMTGNDIDLLQTPSYTFNATVTDYENRFKLVFCTGSNDNSDNFAFCSNDNWIINNDGMATLQVVDMQGRIISSQAINGSASVKVNATAGVYMLHLINGENVRVQKIVVR